MIDIGWLAENGPCKKFSQGQVIPCPGGTEDSERAMYILLSGSVDMTSAGNKTSPAISLSPGDVFGGAEYFSDKAEHFYTAAKESEVYVISESSFADLSWSQPDIVFALLRAAYTPQGKPGALEDAKEKSAQEKAAKEKAEQEKVAQEKAAREKAAQEKAAQEKAAQEKAAQEKAAQEKTAQEKAAQEKAAQEKAAQVKTASKNPFEGAPKEKTEKEKAAQELVAQAVSRRLEAAAEIKAKKDAKPPQDSEKAPQVELPFEGNIFPKEHKGYPGIIKPTYMRLVYPKDYTCPFCKKTFKDFKIFSSKLYESAPMRYDLRRFYTDFQTEWFEIITCHHCYFSMIHTYFSEPKPLYKQKIEHVLTAARDLISMDFDAEREIDFVFTSHYLALLCADGYLSQGNPVRAKIWSNLSWLYEDIEDKEMEKYAAVKAAAAHAEVYSGTRMSPVQEQTTCLAIAGMQIRAGINNDLKKYLYQVITLKTGEKAYIKMAEDIMEDLRASS